MKKNVKIGIGVLLLFLLLTGCTKPNPDAPSPDSNSPAAPVRDTNSPANNQPSPDNTISSRSTPFAFGVEYAVPGLAQAFAETGVHVAKPTPELVLWKYVQASENSALNWTDVDAHVKEYQDSGFDELELLISAESPWASRAASGFTVRDTRPKPEFEDNYQAFVRAVVERYDGDGENDLPGLRFPILYFGIEREFTGFFPGSGEEYVEVLQLAYPAIKEANPNAKVMLNALLMWDVFYGNPSQQEIEARFANPLNGKRKDLDDVSVLLDAHAFFDVIDFHSLGDYSEIPMTVNWLESEMQQRGTQKEIVIGDAFPMSPLMAYGIETCAVTPLAAKVAFPVTNESRCKAAALIATLRNPNAPDYAHAHGWLRKNIAIGLVKKMVVAAASGVRRINIGNMEDWPIPVGAGTSQFMGLMDTRLASFGNQVKARRAPGEKRPGFFALKKVIQELDGFSSVQQKQVGENAFWFEFEKEGRTVVVAWFDEGKFWGLNEEPLTQSVLVSWPNASATVSSIFLEPNSGAFDSRTIPVRNGTLEIELGFTPVFIE